MRYRVKELAARKGVTLKQIAEETGISYSALKAMASRKKSYNATARVIEILCKYFGVTPNELLVIEDHDEPPESWKELKR